MNNKKHFLMILCFLQIYFAYGQLKMATPFPVQVSHGNQVTSIVYELHLMDSLKKPVEFISFTISADNKVLLQDTAYEELPKKSDNNRYVKYIWICKLPQK